MINQSNLAELQSELREATAFITPLRTEIGRIIAGQEKLVDRLIMALITVIQVIFVYLGGTVLRTAPLTLGELGVTVLLALSVFPAELLRKLLWRILHGRGGY